MVDQRGTDEGGPLEQQEAPNDASREGDVAPLLYHPPASTRRVEIGKRKFRVQPDSLKGAERTESWQRIVSLSPGYGGYQQKTDREIPIVRLRPIKEVRS